MFVLFEASIKKGCATVMRAGKGQRSIEPGVPEQQVKDTRRQVAKAERQIRTLQEKVADQKQLLHELQAQGKHESRRAAEREELKAEIADLRSEARELIRANRELVEKIEALQAESAKKASAQVRKPSELAAGMFLHGHPYRGHGESKTQPRQNARRAQSS